MEVPELLSKLRRDGKIVTEDGFINVIKIAIDPVWYLPGVAQRMGIAEPDLREKLYSWTQNKTLLDTKFPLLTCYSRLACDSFMQCSQQRHFPALNWWHNCVRDW